MSDRLRRLLERMKAIDEARDDLVTFARLILPKPEDVDDVRLSLYEAAKHHRAIAAALEEVEKGNYRRLIINAPPRHGKTELVSKLFIAFYLGRNPQNSVIFGTYNEKYAGDVGRRVRDYVRHPAFTQIFPEFSLKEGSEAVDRLETMAGGIAAFVGRGGTTTGRGGHLLVIDDALKDRAEANSATIRGQLWDWFTQVISTRMMDKTARIIIVQTRWHEDDLVGRITDPTNDFYDADEARQWKIIDLPALAGDEDPLGRRPGEALWPQRFDAQFLLDRQRADPRGFAALYQGRPTPEGGAFFKDDSLRTYKPSELPKDLRYYVASDHAVSLVQGSDKTCIIPIGIDKEDNIYVMQDVFWQVAPTDKVVEAMLGLMRKYKPLIWWAEKSHITKSIGPFLRKRMREEDVYCSIHEVTPLSDKQTRAQSIQARMAMGRVFFPERTHWWAAARDELLKFPNGAHDDFVDAMSYVGIGLTLQIAARPKKALNNQPTGKITLGQLIEQSNKSRRQANLARQSGGW